jgi:acyl CoA:acetate/3-ketoacid CoA transferase alpha subunit
VRKVICSAARGTARSSRRSSSCGRPARIELVCLPQGTFAESIRAGGAGIPAYYTPVGVGTDLTRGKEVRRFGDRDYVLEEAIKGELALVARRHLRPLRQPHIPLRPGEFRSRHGHAASLVVAEVRAVVSEPIPQERGAIAGRYVDRVVAVREKAP